MAISNVVARGYGSFGGGVYKVPTRGYGLTVTAIDNRNAPGNANSTRTLPGNPNSTRSVPGRLPNT